MIQRTIRGPPNAQTGSTSNQLTPKAPYKPDPKVCCAAPALAFIQLAHQAACQGVGGARRNDEGLQKGGIPTFINALVNGEVAP